MKKCERAIGKIKMKNAKVYKHQIVKEIKSRWKKNMKVKKKLLKVNLFLIKLTECSFNLCFIIVRHEMVDIEKKK